MTVEFVEPRRDPLLAALIEKLPLQGAPWGDAEREQWLSLMRQAFNLVYGVPIPDTSAARDETALAQPTVVEHPAARRGTIAAATRALEKGDESSVT